MTVRVHPFPSRTRKLSSSVPKILGGRLPGKIGRRRHTVKSEGRDRSRILSSNAAFFHRFILNLHLVSGFLIALQKESHLVSLFLGGRENPAPTLSFASCILLRNFFNNMSTAHTLKSVICLLVSGIWYGPLVKRSRRRPLTPQTGVRFSYGSPRGRSTQDGGRRMQIESSAVTCVLHLVSSISPQSLLASQGPQEVGVHRMEGSY